ncbi:uncharacterized protein LODBEIA_P07890 [Lodderomyces beijingensis]|uniref:Uncharacterized protein n=1 Tax=Lodderomyces beijingensis TaxID=1775926 RepID=A0ABP0ZEH3_9ASCO
MLWLLLLKTALVFLFCAVASAVTPKKTGEERPIFKISSSTHQRALIGDMLQKVADKITNKPSNLSKFRAWSTSSGAGGVKGGGGGGQSRMADDKLCLDNSNIKYFIRTIKLTDQIYDASECRINLNPRMQSILQPTFNIHNLILRDNDTIQTQLKYVLVDEFNRYKQFQDYKFNDFENLNYDLNCLIDYQELMQVEFKETVIEVGLERRIEVDPSCDFNRLNGKFTGTSVDYVSAFVPLNGTFFCKKGKSSSCNRQIAESKHSRYKLPDVYV